METTITIALISRYNIKINGIQRLINIVDFGNEAGTIQVGIEPGRAFLGGTLVASVPPGTKKHGVLRLER